MNKELILTIRFLKTKYIGAPEPEISTHWIIRDKYTTSFPLAKNGFLDFEQNHLWKYFQPQLLMNLLKAISFTSTKKN